MKSTLKLKDNFTKLLTTNMAATTPSPKASAEWLKIAIEYIRDSSEFELTIKFTNSQSAPQELAFSNQARKAELLGLHVVNQAGQRIMPQHNLVIEPNHFETEKHSLLYGEAFSYLLKGHFTEQGLEFPGAIFNLNAGEVYRLRFNYAGQQSNTITLTT